MHGCILAALATASCASSARPLPNVGHTPLALQSADGAPLTLDQLWRDHAATVLVFWSGECPCVRRYQERVDSLIDHYPSDQVRVVGISSNAGESLVDVQRVAKERGVRIPIFRDKGGFVAQALGAHSTPTAVVLDGQGQVRFLGWIDNERLPGDPRREPWLEHAVQGLLDHRDFASRTPIYGCAISRSLLGASAGHCCHEQH
jgi:peroxiredoxin